MQPASNTKLSIQDKAKYKRALLQHGITPADLSRMNDEELYENYTAATALKEVKESEPKSEPKPESKSEPAPKTEEKPAKERVNVPSTSASKLADALSELMGKQELDESRVIELIKAHSSAPLSFVVQQKECKPVEIKGAHAQFKDVLAWLGTGVNVFMAGPAGSGKTTIAQHCAKALSLEFYFTGAIFQKYELLGYCDANGQYVSTQFRECYENGGVFLFDEVDASDAAALVAFNAAIANKICAFPDGKTIKAHKDFYCIAAANTKGKGATREYTGRNPLDAATLDRYAIIDIEYDQKLEREITAAICPDHGEEITRTVIAVRHQAARLKLSCVISPRSSYDAAKAVAKGISIEQALKATLWNKLDDTTRTQLEAK